MGDELFEDGTVREQQAPVDPLHGFDEFWREYPPGPRRTAKPQCREKWKRFGCAAVVDQIIAHVRYMKTDDSWVRGFHPLVTTYLNQRRWEDWSPQDVESEGWMQRVVDVYHEVLTELPAVVLMTDKRRSLLRKAWNWVMTSTKRDGKRRATNEDEAVEWFRRYFEIASDNDFLMGRNRMDWRADLDFLLTDRGMAHVLEKAR